MCCISMLQHINTCVCFSVNKCLKKDKEMFGSDGNPKHRFPCNRFLGLRLSVYGVPGKENLNVRLCK